MSAQTATSEKTQENNPSAIADEHKQLTSTYSMSALIAKQSPPYQASSTSAEKPASSDDLIITLSD